MVVKRELYLSRLREFYESNLIKIIYGVRRSGKSELLKQIKEELLEKGIKSDHILYINLEDMQYAAYLNAIDFNQYVCEQILDDEKYYLLFDEIQMIDEFQKVLSSLKATKNCSIFVTGSNAQVLSGKLATNLGGRYISIKIMPFMFSEVLELYEDKEKIDVREKFDDYLKWGGMPQRFELTSENSIQAYLDDVVNTIIYKDIMIDQKRVDKILTKKILNFLYENTGNIFSDNSVYNELNKSVLDLRKPKVYEIISRIVDAMAVSKCSRFDIKGKKVLSFYEKYYVVDLGLKRALKLNDTPNFGSSLETIIFNELIARGYYVYVGKTYKGEVDFLVLNGDKRCYIQVAYEFNNNEQTIRREFDAFDAISDHYLKYVIALDKEDYSQKGIIYLNALDFLLHKKELEFK